MGTFETIIITFGLILIFVFFLVANEGTRAQPVSAVIDFEVIPPGSIIDQVHSGYGISGAPVDGFVTVVAFTPDSVDVNRAMIFDARCPSGNVTADCTGDDADLFNPPFGNTLIISKDLDTTDPDDADVLGSRIRFEYINLGQGDGATIDSLEVQAIEEDQGELEDARIYFWEGGFTGTIVGSIDIPHTGDGVSALVPVNFTHVDAMGIDLAGSGMINNIRLSAEPTAVELIYFKVDRPLTGEVNMSWATAAEIDNLGFYVYRSSIMSIDDAERIHFEPASSG